MRISIFIALSVFACCMNSNGAATVTASRDYVDRKTTLHPSSNGVDHVGYFLGTQTNKVLASKEYVDNSISDSSPSDYIAVSNAAMKARGKDDLAVYSYSPFMIYSYGGETFSPPMRMNYSTVRYSGGGQAAGWISEETIDASYKFILDSLLGVEYLIKNGDEYIVGSGDTITVSSDGKAITGIGMTQVDIRRESTVVDFATDDRLATTSDIPSVVSAYITASTNYTDLAIAEFSRTGTVERAHSISDGTNTIDASGNVWTTNVIPPWNDGERYWYWDAGNDNWTNGTSYLHLSGNYLVVSGFPYGGGYPADIAQGILDPNELSVDLYYLEGMGEGFFGTFTRQYVPGKTSRLALTNDIPDAPDFSTGNTQLVATIEAKAPAPGNYSVVSNAAMNARDKADLSLYNVTNTFSAWEYYDIAPGITKIEQAEWIDYLDAWSVTLTYNGENFLATISESSQDALSIRYDNPPVTFSARRERVGIIVAGGGLATTNSAGDMMILGSFAQGTNTTASGAYSHAEGDRTIASGKASHAEGVATRAQAEASHASGVNVFVTQRATFGAGVSVSGTNSASFIWNGSETSPWYGTHGKGSFNVNPIGGAYGFFIGNDNLIQVISSSLLAEDPQETTIEYDDGQPVTTNYPSLRAVVEQIVLETIRKNSLSGIYDQQIQTWWTPAMVNGSYKFMATTNIDMNAESGN